MIAATHFLLRDKMGICVSERLQVSSPRKQVVKRAFSIEGDIQIFDYLGLFENLPSFEEIHRIFDSILPYKLNCYKASDSEHSVVVLTGIENCGEGIRLINFELMISNTKEVLIRISGNCEELITESYGSLVYIHRFSGECNTSLAIFIEWISRKEYLVGQRDIGKEIYRFLRTLSSRDHEISF